jgi:hypothetical protein
MLGEWCEDEGRSSEAETVYFRTQKCNNGELIINVRQNGIDGPWSSCSFEKLERDGGIYRGRIYCEMNKETSGNMENYFAQEELELINGQLIIKELPEG